MDDQKLLRDYVLAGSHSALRILVSRHLGLVYSAARRMAQDPHLAEKVTHDVFAALARTAASIPPADVLARWLHDTTRRLATHENLTAARRLGSAQPRTAALPPGPETGAGRIVDDLEAMMDRLPPQDRDVIVLHYLQNRSLPDVAQILGLSEAAAGARVTHAVDQLDARFKAHGVPVASAVLATVLASECAAHVPHGLDLAVATETLAAAAAVPAPASAGSWLTGRTAPVLFIAVLLVDTGIFLRQPALVGQLKGENAQLLAERKKLRTESAEARAGAATESHHEPVRLRRSEGELQRLRREVARLRPLAGAMPPAVAPPAPPPSATVSAAPPEPGTFIVGRDLNFTGYSTPEAAMQSIVWCIVAGSYDAFLTALSPEDRALELEQPDGRASFEERPQQLAPLFHGRQVAALQVLAADAVELKVLLDFGSPTFHIQPLVRINAQWRPSESTRPHDPDWDGDGLVQRFTPP